MFNNCILSRSPSKDVIKEYRAKVAFLKKVIEDAVAVHGANEDDPDAAAEDAATDGQFVTRRSSATLVSPLRPFSRPSGAGGGIGGIGGGSGAPPPVNGDPLAAEIHQRGKERRNLAEREMLLGQSDSGACVRWNQLQQIGFFLIPIYVDLRRRNVAGASSSSTAADFEDLMRVQHEAQEQTAEEMLQLTRALKEQSMAANEIIKKDIGTLEKTDELAERNAEKLAIEAERLAEHTKRSCRCWIWFIILIVSVTFIGT